MPRRTDHHIYFNSEHSPFSNFYPSKLEDANGQCFECMEQAFQHRKALFHNSHQTAQKILQTRNPWEHKRSGNLIDTNQEWRNTEEDVMSEILLYKFTQHPDLSDLLINTGQPRLHEATVDKKWATGSDLSSKATNNGLWSGNDCLGQLLLEGVREAIISGDHLDNSITPTLTPALHSESSDYHDTLAPMSEGEDEDHTLDDLDMSSQQNPAHRSRSLSTLSSTNPQPRSLPLNNPHLSSTTLSSNKHPPPKLRLPPKNPLPPLKTLDLVITQSRPPPLYPDHPSMAMLLPTNPCHQGFYRPL